MKYIYIYILYIYIYVFLHKEHSLFSETLVFQFIDTFFLDTIYIFFIMQVIYNVRLSLGC